MQRTKARSKKLTKNSVKVTKIGHSTMLVEMGGLKILTDPWFTDPIFGVVTHPGRLGMEIDDLPEIDLVLISHGHFDHCDLKALDMLDKSSVAIVPEKKTADRIRKLGFSEVSVLAPWESRLVSKVCVTALPADHPVPECTYVMACGGTSVYFGGDTRYIKQLGEIGEKFDLTVAMLPVNGLRLPFMGKVVMDSVDAAEAAIKLKTRVVIPIHCDISLKVPFLKTWFDKCSTGTPEQFALEIKKRNRYVKVIMLEPGGSWESD